MSLGFMGILCSFPLGEGVAVGVGVGVGVEVGAGVALPWLASVSSIDPRLTSQPLIAKLTTGL